MADGTISLAQLTGWLTAFSDLVTEQRDYLTELDSAIGDADHGINMTRGMDAVVAKISADPSDSVDELFKKVGMTLVTSVGGASGPLYGTFFLRFATANPSAGELDAEGLGSALRAGLGGVVARGKAEKGDKTMFDAIEPALDAYDASVAQGQAIEEAIHAARIAAEAGRDATYPLIALKGRASYLGERSANHLDPGATSSALLFDALDDAVNGQQE